VTETRYLVPPGADWAVWDDAKAILSFITDAEVVENARENESLLGGELGRELPPDPSPEQARAYMNELWEGDPGGRGWHVRVPAGATWLARFGTTRTTSLAAQVPRRGSASGSHRWARALGLGSMDG
jgi:hypothetical protein